MFTSRDSAKTAIVMATEGGTVRSVSWGELEEQVADVAGLLRGLGAGVGDRVVGYLPNGVAAVVGLSATASIGAI